MEKLTIEEKSLVKIAIEEKIKYFDTNINICKENNLDFKFWESIKFSLENGLKKINNLEMKETENIKNIYNNG